MNRLPELEPYYFDPPAHLAAQRPPKERGGSRLLVLERGRPENLQRVFGELPGLLPPKSLLVFNNVKVDFRRLFGHKTGTGARLEAFILEPPPAEAPAGPYDLWCLVRPGRRLKPGSVLDFSRPGTGLTGEILAADAEGRRLIRFHFQAPPAQVLETIGLLPLPFYIKRPEEPEDRDRYQTVYATVPGAAAAPTAGLHFTGGLMAELKAAGFMAAEITLKIGAGTFAPLTRTQLEEGRLHRENIKVSEETAQAVNQARQEGRPVVAVGSTSVRALEWAAGDGRVRAAAGWGDLFIRPGYRFRAVDGLITNFHLPGSSLLLLVAALAGRERILAAYAEAAAAGFRFYSYGDAMLIK